MTASQLPLCEEEEQQQQQQQLRAGVVAATAGTRSPLGESQISNTANSPHTGSEKQLKRNSVVLPPGAVFRHTHISLEKASPLVAGSAVVRVAAADSPRGPEASPVEACPKRALLAEVADGANGGTTCAALQAFGIFDDSVKTATAAASNIQQQQHPRQPRLSRSLSHSASPVQRTPSMSPSGSGSQTDAVPQAGFMMRFGMSPVATHRRPGHVWFNSPANSAVDITPYSKIYGLHPRLFNFDSTGSMQLTPRADAPVMQPLPPPPLLATPVRAQSPPPPPAVHAISTQRYGSYSVMPGSLGGRCSVLSTSGSHTRLRPHRSSNGSVERGAHRENSPCGSPGSSGSEVAAAATVRRMNFVTGLVAASSAHQPQQHRTALTFQAATAARSCGSRHPPDSAPSCSFVRRAAPLSSFRSTGPAASVSTMAGPALPSPQQQQTPKGAAVFSGRRHLGVTAVAPCHATSWGSSATTAALAGPRSPLTAGH